MQGTYSKTDSIVFRCVDKTDLDSVFSIENQVAIAPWTKEMFIGSLNLYDFIVAVDQNSNKLIGYGIIIIHASISEAHILNLAVDQDYQRTGVGSRLLAKLINLAKLKITQNINTNQIANQIDGKIFLEVCASNVAAIVLYKKFKFIEIGLRKKYYYTKSGKQDALIYVLNL